MTDFTLTRLDKFPEGTNVDAIPAGGYRAPRSEQTAAATETMTGDGVTFTGLDDGSYFFVEDGDLSNYVLGLVGAAGEVSPDDAGPASAAEINAAYDEELLVGIGRGTPAVSDDDFYVTSVDMKATAYTQAETAAPGGIPRNVIVTHTADGTADTRGSLVVTGTNADGEEITESIVIADGTVSVGAKAFKTVTSLVTPSWVTEGNADEIKVGFGNLLGLDRTLAAAAQVFLAVLGTAIIAPTVAVDDDEVEKNTVDLSSGTYNGTKAAKVLLVP